MTTKTTVETSQSAMRARKSRWPRNGRNPRMTELPLARPLPHGERPGEERRLRATELEVEAAKLELLVRVRSELHVLLQTVVLVRLDHRQPGQVLQEDLGHLPVGLPAELLVHAEARRVAQLVELGLAPVVLRSARA